MERIYFDTSVFGGYFDPEFELWTKLLFNKINNREIKMLYSQMTEIELAGAPQNIRDLIRQIPGNQIEFISLTEEQKDWRNCILAKALLVKQAVLIASILLLQL